MYLIRLTAMVLLILTTFNQSVISQSSNNCRINRDVDKFTDKVSLSTPTTILREGSKQAFIFPYRYETGIYLSINVNQDGFVYCTNGQQKVTFLFADSSKVIIPVLKDIDCEGRIGLHIAYSEADQKVSTELQYLLSKQIKAIRCEFTEYNADFDLSPLDADGLKKDLQCLTKEKL